jgi:hypothetical protein
MPTGRARRISLRSISIGAGLGRSRRLLPERTSVRVFDGWYAGMIPARLPQAAKGATGLRSRTCRLSRPMEISRCAA